MGSPGSLMREVRRSKGEDAQPAQAPGCDWYGILTRMRNSPRPVRGGWASEASISTGAQGSTFITTRFLSLGSFIPCIRYSPPPNPPSAEPRLYAPEPWTIHHNNPGPVTLTLRRSHIRCTLLRRRTSPDLSLVRSSMVRPRIRPSIHSHLRLHVILGVVMILFFRCIGALFNPVNRTERGVKWGLVAHTTAMFSFITVYTATGLDLQSISYINKRAFPGVDGVLSPGPLGYQFLIYSNAINVVPTLMFQLNNWLADGLLVSSIRDSVSQVPNADRSPSSIVVLLFTP